MKGTVATPLGRPDRPLRRVDFRGWHVAQARSGAPRENFLALLLEHGLDARDVVMNMNLFMNVPLQPDGAMAIEHGWSKPGDHVDLRAELDVLCLATWSPATAGGRFERCHHHPLVVSLDGARAASASR